MQAPAIRPAVALLFAAALLLGTRPLDAQTRVHGAVLEAASEQPLAGAVVTISTNRGRWQRSVRTDSAGAWGFAGLPRGPYRLHAARVGYRDASGELEIAGDTALSVSIRMAVEAVVLEPLTVIGRAVPEVSPVLRGFYERMRNGPGRFVTRAEIEDRRPSQVTDMLRGMPNVRLAAPGSGMGGGVLSRGSASGRCSVVVFVDGMRLTQATFGGRGVGSSDVPIDDYVHPGDVEGIEVYRGESDTPAEFMTRWVGCGTVVIWTRRGGRRG